VAAADETEHGRRLLAIGFLFVRVLCNLLQAAAAAGSRNPTTAASTHRPAAANAAPNRIMIYGPKTHGPYIIEFRTAGGEALAISVPRNETAVLKHFQERMPMGYSGLTFLEEYLPRQGCFPDGVTSPQKTSPVRVPEDPTL
jgi:hypothetical protein